MHKLIIISEEIKASYEYEQKLLEDGKEEAPSSINLVVRLGKNRKFLI